jgi:hypothetical protein
MGLEIELDYGYKMSAGEGTELLSQSRLALSHSLITLYDFITYHGQPLSPKRAKDSSVSRDSWKCAWEPCTSLTSLELKLGILRVTKQWFQHCYHRMWEPAILAYLPNGTKLEPFVILTEILMWSQVYPET